MDRRVGLYIINRKVEKVAAIGAAALTTAATLLGAGASSAEAAAIAATQPAISRSAPPKKDVLNTNDCSVVGFQVPTSAEGPVRARIKGTVNLSVELVDKNGEGVKDVTRALLEGERRYDQVDLQGQVLREISTTPAEKPDFGFVADPSEDPYKGPIGRAVFRSGQISSLLQEIRRFDKDGGGHEWNAVNDFVEIVRETSKGLKAYKNECGLGEVLRRYQIIIPRYLNNGKHYDAGAPIEVADGCETPVSFTRKYRVVSPQAPVEQPVSQPDAPHEPMPAPAQTPAEHRGVPAPYQTPK